VLRGALRWLEHLWTSDVARVRALLAAHRAYSDLTPVQYDAALGWLKRVGLVLEDRLIASVPAGAFAQAHLLFVTALETSRPAWFIDADQLVRTRDELPADAVAVARALGLTDAEAFACVRSAWGKVDTSARSRVGAAGESALRDILAETLDAEVRHVSVVSDGFGYDLEVAPAAASVVHIEVKTTSRRSRLVVHLSRHEFETMCADPAWMMVAVLLGGDDRAEAVATVSRDWIRDVVPVDRAPRGAWESARLDVPPQALTPGILALARFVKPTSRLAGFVVDGLGGSPVPSWLG
jgi:hypothetical protein